jgi:glycosyltransferase involved in cell wall biosynthesis
MHEALGYSTWKSLVIPNGFDIDSLKAAWRGRASMRARLGILEGEQVIGCVGRFHDDKGPDVFLKAASLVRGVDRRVRFMMVGREMVETNSILMNWIADLGLTGSVLLLGEQPDVPAYLAAMDVFCLPSRTEGFPNVVGEAMGAGLCCVVTDVGDAAHLLGGTGYVVPPDNPSALSAGLLSFVNMSAAERMAIGRSAQDRIEGQFSLKAVAAAYSDFYQSL